MSGQPASVKRGAALFVVACATALVLAGCWTTDPPTQGAAATWDEATWDAGRFGP